MLYSFSIFLFVFICLFLCFLILIQDSQSSGLGSTFGGGQAADSMQHVSAAQVLKKFTAWLVAFFFISCLIMSFWTASLGRHSIAMQANQTVEKSTQ